MTDNPTKTHALLFGIRDGSEFEMDHLTKIRDALVLPVRNWKKNERSEKKKIKKVRTHKYTSSVWLMIIQRTSEIFKVYKSLPNLRYLENGVSTYYEEELASREMKLLEDDGITVKQHFDVGFELNEDLVYSSNYPPQCFSDHLASVRGAKILFCNAIQTITSLKIRSMPFYSKLGVVMVSQNLRCLNLEILRLSRRGTEIDDQERTLKDSDLPMTAVWRRYLYRLRQLETLRLGFLYGGRRDTEYLDNFYAIYHLDELLIDPDNMDDCCLLPKLKRLELFDSTVRLANLLRVIANHRETLKALTLTRITFELEESLRYWCEIARMCKEAAPGLTYLRLVKLVTGPPKRYVHDPEGSLFHGPNADSDLKPTPEGWRSGLEDAMTYEWQKGTANGTDREFIGIKCPWTGDEDEEAPSDSAANLIVGRDRFWSNHPDIVR